jgi:hypothetical protein
MNKLANLTFDHDLPKIRGDPRISAPGPHFILLTTFQILHFSAGKVCSLKYFRLYFVFYYKNIIFFLTNPLAHCYVEVF